MQYCKFKSIELEAFKNDLRELFANKTQDKNDLDGMLAAYSEGIKGMVDKHAPLKRCRLPDKPQKPWFTDGITQEIQIRWKTERAWHADPIDDTKYQLFKLQRKHVTQIIKAAEWSYLNATLTENKGNSKEIYKICNNLLGCNMLLPLPDYTNPATMAQSFNDFFTDKIDKIMAVIEDRNKNTFMIPSYVLEMDEQSESTLTCFRNMTEDKIKNVKKHFPSKSCDIDPLPTTPLKACIDVLTLIITDIVNCSLRLGSVSKAWKMAQVQPLLNKLGMALLDMNYRPVSNLSFISKIIEKCVAEQLVDHIGSNGLNEIMQSAYKKRHSTETALLRVKSDILQNFEDDNVTCLVLLDLSATFNTVNHKILLQRLQHRYGIKGVVLKWLESYLTEGQQCVIIDGELSETALLIQGVSQGSVLCPILFTLYTAPLGNICCNHGIPYMMYADDQQFYLGCRTTSQVNYVKCMESKSTCVTDIKHWMNVNYLKLNGDKTELIFLGTPQQLAKCHEIIPDNIILLGDNIKPAAQVHNLGYWMDPSLKKHSHINKTVQSSNLLLKGIARICPFLTLESCRLIINGLITSKVDYCNSLLAGTSNYQLRKLQALQDMACRIICALWKCDHISSQIQDLHWLKDKEQITFKIAVFMFLYIRNQAPVYLKSLLPCIKTSHRTLRPSTSNQIDRAYCKNSQAKAGAFQYIGPIVWNNLPVTIRTGKNLDMFKNKCKTYLFDILHSILL